MSNSYSFEDFFASGSHETASPFLTAKAKRWGKHLSLKAALFSAFFLACAFAASFFHESVSHFFLILVYFLSGTPALIDSLEDLKEFEVNIEVLMTLAALLSVAIGSAMEGALLLVLFELSAAMENAVTQKTKGAILSLNKLTPRTAHVLTEDGDILPKAIRDITVGTKIFIKSGEIIPLDGKVIQGRTFLNLVHLTGESHPVSVKTGDEVVSGSQNLDGSLTIEVTKTSENSTLARLIQLIMEAQEKKPKLERLLDRFGKGYALSIILLSAFFALFLPFIFGIPYLGIDGSIYRSLAFLVAASPCALIIATPTAYLSAISSCAKKGILLKGGAILDALARSSIIAFDKTGTLTTGKLQLVDFTKWQGDLSEEAALAVAATLEKGASHPIANAILASAKIKEIPFLEVEGFKATSGAGVEGIVFLDGKYRQAFMGNYEFIESKIPASLKEKLQETSKEGHLSAHLYIDEGLYSFYFKDEIRSFSFSLIQRLKTKWRILMLTGDKHEGAKEVASILGIQELFANLRPDEKLAHVEKLSEQGGLIMVGDGINDAPSLARATVGVSMGGIGSTAAVEASDIIFLKDDLSHLDWLTEKAAKTLKIVKQNLLLAASVILFATLPSLLGFVPLWIAVILHEGGTVLVGLNSLRLLRK